MNYLKITKEEMEIEKTLLEIYKKLYSKMPAGRLTSKRVKGRTYYYCVDEKTRKATYIPKLNVKLILQLKQKRWLEECIKVLKENLHVQSKVLKKYNNYDGQSIQNRLSKSYSDAMLEEYEKKYLIDLDVWSREEYRKNPYHEEHLRYETSFGLRVRSKSELLIAELLCKYGIPFRYDAAVRVRGNDGKWKTYYADFIIMLPTGEQILWEHMGLLGKEDYRRHAFEKLTDYFHHGYFVPNNLIITMDGPTGELDVAAIKRIIEGQLLPFFAEK